MNLKIKNQKKLQSPLFLIIGCCLTIILLLIVFNQNQNKLPHQKKVNQFLDSLTYSALKDIARDDFYLELNFEHGIWIMKNLFSYDQKKRLINFKTRQGTCTQLSQITYDFIKPLFEDDYRILFVKGNDAFFFREDAEAGPSHYFLKLVPKENRSKKNLIIDPSYKLYDYAEKFSGYNIEEKMGSLNLFSRKEKDLALWAGVNYPIFFLEEKEKMLSLAAIEVDGKYDQNNHALAVFATQKGQESSRVLFTFMLRGGDFFAFRDQELISKMLSRKQKKELTGIVFELFNNRQIQSL